MKYCILLSLLALGLAEKARFDGVQVWEVAVNGVQDAHFLMGLHKKGLIADIEGALKRSGMVSILVNPKLTRFMGTQLLKKGMAYSVMVENLQDLIDEEDKRFAARATKVGGMAYDPDDFNTYSENYDHMNQYVDFCPGKGLVCEVVNAGDSHEGRPINIYKVSTGGTKPIIWIDATINSREWLSTTTAVHMFDYLIEQYGSNQEVDDILNDYEFWFLPIGNPDGYIYSWFGNRLWNKNRREFLACTGVDLNRNFDFRHCLQGGDDSPCSDDYCGPFGGSEAETQAYQNAISSVANRLTTLISLHSYGEMWMHPWGNNIDYSYFNPCERADDHDDMFAAAKAAADAIYQVSGNRWDYGTSCEVNHATTGATDDWAKGTQNVKYSYRPELRGISVIAPPELIRPSFREVWAATIALVREIERIEGGIYPRM